MGTKNNPGKFDCFSKAEPDEPMFVLLGRDPVAATLVQLWAELRLRMGASPEKVEEARKCAFDMADYASEHGHRRDEALRSALASIGIRSTHIARPREKDSSNG